MTYHDLIARGQFTPISMRRLYRLVEALSRWRYFLDGATAESFLGWGLITPCRNRVNGVGFRKRKLDIVLNGTDSQARNFLACDRFFGQHSGDLQICFLDWNIQSRYCWILNEASIRFLVYNMILSGSDSWQSHTGTIIDWGISLQPTVIRYALELPCVLTFISPSFSAVGLFFLRGDFSFVAVVSPRRGWGVIHYKVCMSSAFGIHCWCDRIGDTPNIDTDNLMARLSGTEILTIFLHSPRLWDSLH